MTIISMKGL